MIRIISPGIPKYEYTHTCPECMCVYTYSQEDICHDYSLTMSNLPYIICPCCGVRNNITQYIPYNPLKKEPYEWWKVTCYHDTAETKRPLHEGDCQDEQN